MLEFEERIYKIPRVVHYCWFGRGKKPDIVNVCMDSWNRHLSGYEIKEWNEENFDIRTNAYVQEAYECKKFAFVSDYARAYVLYHFGGIYLDTDVEVFRPFDDLLYHDSFWGFEQENYIATSTIGAVAGNKLVRRLLQSYEGKRFINDNGTFNELTNVAIISNMVNEAGLRLDGQYQTLEGVGTFFPQTFFSPYDYIHGRKFITENTYAMHHFHKSWLPPTIRFKANSKIMLSKIIGGDNLYKIKKFFT